MGGEERLCVVTGGRGFAARHLVEMLIRYEMFTVRVADLGPSINLSPEEEKGTLGQALTPGRAHYVSMDLRDKSQVLRGFEGAEVVFHMAAPDSSINNYELHYSVNVKGTQNVIDACVELKVKRLIYTSSPRLIYTSSPSVVFDGVHGIVNGDESLPYPSKHNDTYSATKAEGETLVIKANGTKGLLTCCIRPSSIFGPGDKLLVPSLVTAARAGKLKFLIGDGNNMYDFTYVENVAHAHICAERALASDGTVAGRASGEAYFITNIEPIKFWEFVSLILEGLGYERERNTELMREAILVPYMLLPYFYTLFIESNTMGAPVMRPLWMEFPANEVTFSNDEAFTVGGGILVQGVFTERAKQASVYLPSGQSWYNLKSGTAYKGGATHTVEVTDDSIPVFQRAGTIIPRKDRFRRSSTQMENDPYTLVIALNSTQEAEGELYIDDGKGAYIHRRFIFSNGKLASINMAPGGNRFVSDCVIERVILLGYSHPGRKSAVLIEPSNQKTEVELAPLYLHKKRSPAVVTTIL